VPARVEIDFDAGEARWFSLMGVEELDLASPVGPTRTVF